ncbi:MAG: hypothetical protein ABI724_01320 [Betaproteobacteria bacterium]
MRDVLALTLSVALPWVAGTLWIRAALRRTASPGAMICIGYGYLVGLFGVTVVMRGLDLVGALWNVAWIALPVAALAVAAYLSVRPLAMRADFARTLEGLAALAPSIRALFAVLLALTAIRAVMLGVEVMMTPLVAYDALAHWATKSRVWFEYGRMASFVHDSAWGKAAGLMNFTDTHPEYPGTVPLFQVWTALCIGRWDESLINAPWVAGFVSLGIAFYAQARRLGIGALPAMFGSYVLLSLPYLTIQVALAGYADIFIAIAYGLSAMALWQWSISRQWGDAALALVMAVICASLKQEGILWVLTLLPGALVAVNRRLGLSSTALVAALAVGFLALAPAELSVFGYALRTRFDNVSRPLYEHLFVMDNWHLLWYAVVAVIVLNVREIAGNVLAPMSVTMLAAAGFIVVVFYFSNASWGVRDETLTNRLVLQIVPALVFYVALILRVRSNRTVPASGSISTPA